MSHTACHFTPRSLLLSLQQIRQIFKYQNISQTLTLMLKSRHRDGDVKFRRLQNHFQLRSSCAHALGTPQQWLQILKDVGGEQVTKFSTDQSLEHAGFRSHRMEHTQKRMVQVRN